MTVFSSNLRWTIVLVAVTLAPSASIRSQETSSAKPAATNSLDAHLGRGYEALRRENYAQAADEFRAALDLNPKLVLKAQFPLAVALFEMHKTEEARSAFEAVRWETGDHPNVLYYLG